MLPVGWGGRKWGGSQEGFRCPFSSSVPQDSGSSLLSDCMSCLTTPVPVRATLTPLSLSAVAFL